MCTPVEGRCEPRNWWYNLSIQVLNVLFTYGVLVTMPSNPNPSPNPSLGNHSPNPSPNPGPSPTLSPNQVTMPWRLADAHHLGCSRHSTEAGCDLP